MTGLTVVVLAKRPVPGLVKTRLVPPLNHVHAARIAAAALRDTMAVVDRSPVRRRVLAFDGDPSGWRPPGWTVTRQPPGGLDRRIATALSVARGPVLLVGMDTPQLQPADLAFDPHRYDAALGLAADGGYWTIGLRDPRLARVAVHGIPMSTEVTGSAQLARLRELGLRVQLLAEHTDVDTIDTAETVARIAPASRFAAALADRAVPA